MQTLIQNFHLPRYQDLPNMGLYLEQTTKYINHFLSPLGCIEITPSMVGNYVKKGLIPPPVKKLYYAEQLAYLFFVSIAKQVLTMEQITSLIQRQKETYSAPVSYDYFCMELENMLYYVFGITATIEDVGATHTHTKNLLRSVIVAAAQVIYLDRCLTFPQPATDEEV